MKYVLILIACLLFIGCGGESSDSSEGTSNGDVSSTDYLDGMINDDKFSDGDLSSAEAIGFVRVNHAALSYITTYGLMNKIELDKQYWIDTGQKILNRWNEIKGQQPNDRLREIWQPDFDAVKAIVDELNSD